MFSWNYIFTCLATIYLFDFSNCVELTFELPDNAKECFYQEIRKNQSATLEFQVIIFFFFGFMIIL